MIQQQQVILFDTDVTSQNDLQSSVSFTIYSEFCGQRSSRANLCVMRRLGLMVVRFFRLRARLQRNFLYKEILTL
jgi:hypothetical protein